MNIHWEREVCDEMDSMGVDVAAMGYLEDNLWKTRETSVRSTGD